MMTTGTKNTLYFLSVLLFMAIGVLMRLPYYTHYFVPGITVDSLAYADFAKNIFLKEIPAFRAYTPGYPLFIYITEVLGPHNMRSFFLIQTAINFIIFGLIIRALFNTRYLGEGLKYLFLFILIVFFNSSATLSMETTMNPVQIYTSLSMLLVILFARIILDSDFSLSGAAGASVVFCFMILLRPQGIVFAPLFALVILILFMNRKYRQVAAALSLPVVVVILTCGYNYFSLGSFNYTTQQSNQDIRSSAMFADKKSTQPAYIRAALDSGMGKLHRDYPGMAKEEIVKAHPGYCIDEYADYVMNVISGYYHGDIPKLTRDTVEAVFKADRNSALYLSKIMTCMKLQIRDNSLPRKFYISELKERIRFIEEPGYFKDLSQTTEKIVTRDFYPYYYEGRHLFMPDGRSNNILTRLSFLINTRMSSILRILPLGYIYVLVLLVFFVFTAARFSQLYTDKRIIMTFLILMIPVANYCLIALYVYPTKRYSYLSDFFTMISPVLLVVLIYDLYFGSKKKMV